MYLQYPVLDGAVVVLLLAESGSVAQLDLKFAGRHP